MAVVRAKLKFTDRDDFIRGFAPLLSRAGLFIRTKSIKPVGTPVRFEFRLANDTPIFVGEGLVRKEVPFDPLSPQKPCGMLVGLRKLDRNSKSVFDDVLALKARASATQSREMFTAAPNERGQADAIPTPVSAVNALSAPEPDDDDLGLGPTIAPSSSTSTPALRSELLSI